MSNHDRALVIGLLGPAISGVGYIWILLKPLAIDPERATFRYLLFDAPHMMVAVGIVVGLLLLPIALSVAAAEEDEVEIPEFGAERGELESEDQPSREPAGSEGEPRWSLK